MIDRENFKKFVIRSIGDLVEKNPTEIDTTADFSDFGLNSLVTVVLLEEINSYLGRQVVHIDEMYELSTIEELCDYICSVPVA